MALVALTPDALAIIEKTACLSPLVWETAGDSDTYSHPQPILVLCTP